jgi:large subunit ribosomal protein L17
MRRNMASALLDKERIVTTPQKAKEVRPFVERLITLARRALPYKNTGSEDDRAQYLHYYRMVLSRLQDKKMVQKLFGEGDWREEGDSLAERYADRPGGYTRILRIGGSRLGVTVGGTVTGIPEFTYEINGERRSLRMVGNRLGDNAEQVLFELVTEEPEEEEEVAPTVTVTEGAEQEGEGETAVEASEEAEEQAVEAAEAEATEQAAAEAEEQPAEQAEEPEAEDQEEEEEQG